MTVTETVSRERETITGNGEMKNGNKRDLEIKLLIRLGFKLGFFPVFIFPFAVFVSHSPFSVLVTSKPQTNDSRRWTMDDGGKAKNDRRNAFAFLSHNPG